MSHNILRYLRIMGGGAYQNLHNRFFTCEKKMIIKVCSIIKMILMLDTVCVFPNGKLAEWRPYI